MTKSLPKIGILVICLFSCLLCPALYFWLGLANENAKFNAEIRKKMDAFAQYREDHEKEKINQLHEIAEQGDAEAQYQLGTHYFKGAILILRKLGDIGQIAIAKRTPSVA